MAVDLLVFNTLNACDALGTPWDSTVCSFLWYRSWIWMLAQRYTMHYGLPTRPSVHLLMTWSCWCANEGIRRHIPSKTRCLSLLEACRHLISSTDTACLISLAHVNSVVYLTLQFAIDEVFIFKVLHQDDIIVLLKATRYLQRHSDNFRSLWLRIASLAVRTRERF
jgi:hypothetical protein